MHCYRADVDIPKYGSATAVANAEARGDEVEGRYPVPVCLGLYRWQREALEAWSANDRRGVVEAVTGAGKTRVGLHAIAAQLAAGGKAAVVVPTRELLHQWTRGAARDSAGGSDWSIG